MNKKMPTNFFWGNSTSSMQTEGAWNIDGKGKSVYDIRVATPTTSDWKDGIDGYHRYQEDIALMREAGMNCYRFQISWSRVNPQGDGDYNEKGIEFYDKLIDEIISQGMTPIACLYHFDMPLHLAEKNNGFMDRKTVAAFVRYGKEMIDRFSHKVAHWITFNELNLYITPEAFNISGYTRGEKTIHDLYTLFNNVMVAHAELTKYINANHSLQTGCMIAYIEVYPSTSLPEDVYAARKIDEFINQGVIELCVNGRYSTEVMAYMENNGLADIVSKEDKELFKDMKNDFVAFSYYSSTTVDYTKIPENTPYNMAINYGRTLNPHMDHTEWGAHTDPLGFRTILTKLYNRFHIPLFPVENGIGLQELWDGNNPIEDDYRIDYHRRHFQAMKDAMFLDGVEVIGYLGWGLIDIPSSQGDMRKRYGIIYVNRTNEELRDMKRVKKKSFDWMKAVFEANGDELF